jgi:hypothetical protein
MSHHNATATGGAPALATAVTAAFTTGAGVGPTVVVPDENGIP